MNEVHERNIRKNNVVVFGLQDSNNKGVDKNMVCDLLNQVQSTDQENVKLFRIGKFDPSNTKMRPLKIIFQDELAMRNVLTNAKMLKENDSFKHLTVSVDRTPMQIEYYKKIRSQLLERKANGENDIRIRHIHGIPKIVKFNADLN